MKTRALAIFADAPVLFFAVVIGVALTFRVTIGVIRAAAMPPEVAPTFVSGPEPGLPSTKTDAETKAAGATATATATDPATAAALPQAEVGAAGKILPLGTPSSTSPTPARLAPKPRGHGRRPLLRGGTER